MGRKLNTPHQRLWYINRAQALRLNVASFRWACPSCGAEPYDLCIPPPNKPEKVKYEQMTCKSRRACKEIYCKQRAYQEALRR